MSSEADRLRGAIAEWRRRKTNPVYLGALAVCAEKFAEYVKELAPIRAAFVRAMERFVVERQSLYDVDDKYSGRDAAAGGYIPPRSQEEILKEHLKHVAGEGQTVCARGNLFLTASRERISYSKSAANFSAQLVIWCRAEADYRKKDEDLLRLEAEIVSSKSHREKLDPKTPLADELARKIYTSKNIQIGLLRNKRILMDRLDVGILRRYFDDFCAELASAEHYARALATQATSVKPARLVEPELRSVQTLDAYVELLRNVI